MTNRGDAYRRGVFNLHREAWNLIHVFSNLNQRKRVRQPGHGQLSAGLLPFLMTDH